MRLDIIEFVMATQAIVATPQAGISSRKATA